MRIQDSHAYAGKILRVDLNSRTTSIEPTVSMLESGWEAQVSGYGYYITKSNHVLLYTLQLTG